MLNRPVKNAFIVLFFIFAEAGCAIHPPIKGSEQQNSQNKIKPPDWSHPKEVTFILNEYSIQKSGSDAPFLELRVGDAYKLNIRNNGLKFHIFTADSFFRTIALAKISFGKNTEVASSRIQKIKVGAGKSVTLFLIPMKEGVYDVICELKLHLNAGMRSRIVVRGNPAGI